MKPFRFRLEKVLSLRRTQLELEEARFQQQHAAVAELDRRQADMDDAAIRSELELRQWSPLDGQDLAALSGFRRHVRDQRRELAARREQAIQRLSALRQAMLEARRRCRLLELLKERRVAEWQAEDDREWERAAGESYLAAMVRRRS